MAGRIGTWSRVMWSRVNVVAGDVVASDEVTSAKRALRARLLDARRRRPAHELAATATALRDQTLARPELTTASTVAAYASATHEPGTWPLLEALHAEGVRILLPVIRPDLDLDWADYDAGSWAVGRFGIREPAGARLGLQAITTAEVVICPGVAGDRAGNRLGKGGGSFDRALGRLDPAVPRLLLLYDEEVLDGVPAAPHDQPVDVLVTPTHAISTTRRAAPAEPDSPTGAGNQP